MDGETNTTAMEPTAETGGASVSSTPAAEVSEAPDWYKGIESASDDDLSKLLDEHPKFRPLVERKAQSHADRVLLKQTDKILTEAKANADRIAREQAWQQQWANMPRNERAEFVLRNQEMQDQLGRTIGSWWTEQSQAIKDGIPEFKGKPMEEWGQLMEKHPNSFKDFVSAAINEAVEARFAKELPKRVKEATEAQVKRELQSTYAGSPKPDMGKGGAGASFANLSPKEIRERVKAMSPAEYAENEDEILANLPFRR